MSKTLSRILVVIGATFTAFLLVYAEVPKGWYLAGSKPAEYDSGLDRPQPMADGPARICDLRRVSRPLVSEHSCSSSTLPGTWVSGSD